MKIEIELEKVWVRTDFDDEWLDRWRIVGTNRIIINKGHKSKIDQTSVTMTDTWVYVSTKNRSDVVGYVDIKPVAVNGFTKVATPKGENVTLSEAVNYIDFLGYVWDDDVNFMSHRMNGGKLYCCSYVRFRKKRK